MVCSFGGPGFLRIEAVKTGFGRSATRYSSASRFRLRSLSFGGPAVASAEAGAHAGAIPKELLDVALCEDGREEARHGQAHSVLGQRNEYLRETPRYVGHLN